ncbi:MAG: redoxin domain-containing protein [Bacteroidota bacterium]
MKQLFTILTIVFFTAHFAVAQDAPDFSIVDTKGDPHTLYMDYLDQGKTVVLDLFFVNCPPCNDLAPLLEPLYQEWGAGQGDVEFFSITGVDNNASIDGFKAQHGVTFPAAGTEGNGPATEQPYTSNQFGTFLGYPTLVVIAPDRTVTFDVWGGSMSETVDLLDQAIEATGAEKPNTNSVEELAGSNFNMSITPNPVVDAAMVDFQLKEQSDVQVELVNAVGQTVRTVFNGSMNAGFNQVSLFADDLVAGSYLVVVRVNGAQLGADRFFKVQ